MHTLVAEVTREGEPPMVWTVEELIQWFRGRNRDELARPHPNYYDMPSVGTYIQDGPFTFKTTSFARCDDVFSWRGCNQFGDRHSVVLKMTWVSV